MADQAAPVPSPRYINLDYAASTPLRPEARAAFDAYDASDISGANPNSLHSLGRRAARALDGARADIIASTLGSRVRPSDIVFTSGGTESNHLALLGLAEALRARDAKRSRVLVSAIEHDSVIDNLAPLKARGFTCDLVPVTDDGILDLDQLEGMLGPDVALVSIMLANNETGVVQPVGDAARLAHAAGALVHTDAVQGWLHIPVDVTDLDVDALSLAGHKVGGPVGIGALYIRPRIAVAPQVRGGGQERGLRAGTQDVRGALALAAVARALHPTIPEDRARVAALADRLYARLLDDPRVTATTGDVSRVERLPGIVSILVAGAQSEDLILKLDRAGFAVSAGSACSSGSAEASHVLRAMGISEDRAAGSLRISFDDRVDPDDLDRFADVLKELLR